MKKIDKVKFFIAFFLLIAVVGVIMFPLVEWIICKVFTHTAFTYSAVEHIVKPVGIALVVSAVVTMTVKWDKVNKNKK